MDRVTFNLVKWEQRSGRAAIFDELLSGKTKENEVVEERSGTVYRCPECAGPIWVEKGHSAKCCLAHGNTALKRRIFRRKLKLKEAKIGNVYVCSNCHSLAWTDEKNSPECPICKESLEPEDRLPLGEYWVEVGNRHVEAGDFHIGRCGRAAGGSNTGSSSHWKNSLRESTN